MYVTIKINRFLIPSAYDIHSTLGSRDAETFIPKPFPSLRCALCLIVFLNYF
jgi:hypothetical protein